MGKSVSESLFHSLIRIANNEDCISLQYHWLILDNASRLSCLGQYLAYLINVLTIKKNLVIHFIHNDCILLKDEELNLYSSLLNANPNLTIFTSTSRCDYFRNNNFYSILNLRQDMNTQIPMVYISYKHYDDFKDIAKREKYTNCLNNIKRGLEDINAPYSIDYQKIRYRDSIKSFEEEIGNGLTVIAIITPEYLKSVGCMYELAQVFENGNIDNRLFPVVDIDRSIDTQNEVINFWDTQLTTLKKNSAERPYVSESFSTEIVKLELIYKHIGPIWKYLCDRNADSMENMTEKNAQKLMNEISNANSSAFTSMPEKAETNDKSITQYKDDVPTMSIVQNGDHSIGIIKGDVTFNFS